MQVLSKNWTIVCGSHQAVIPRADAAIPNKSDFYHPICTVLEFDDDEAQSLIERGVAERYDRQLHGENPAAGLARRGASTVTQTGGTQ